MKTYNIFSGRIILLIIVIMIFSCQSAFFKDSYLIIKNESADNISSFYLCSAFVSDDTNIDDSTPWDIGSILSNSQEEFT